MRHPSGAHPLLSAAITGVVVAACGGGSVNSSVTLHVSGSGGSLDVVLSGDSHSITSFAHGVSRAVSSSGSAGGDVRSVDGDRHSGAFVCQATVRARGAVAQLAVYSTISGLNAGICSQIQQSVQSGG